MPKGLSRQEIEKMLDEIQEKNKNANTENKKLFDDIVKAFKNDEIPLIASKEKVVEEIVPDDEEPVS